MSQKLQHDANSNAVEKVCSGENISANEICNNCTAGCSSNVDRCETMEDVKAGDFICLHEVSVSGCVFSHCERYVLFDDVNIILQVACFVWSPINVSLYFRCGCLSICGPALLI